MTDTRRAFLLKMAKGAAYTAPVIVTLAAPDGLLGQGQSTNSQKGGMGLGMPCPPGQGKMDVCEPVAPKIELKSELPSAPWKAPPPGSSGPPAGGRGN